MLETLDSPAQVGPTITVSEYCLMRVDRPEVFLPTFQGALKVRYIRGFHQGDPWAVCGDGLSQVSFMMGNCDLLYTDLAQAEESARRAGWTG